MLVCRKRTPVPFSRIAAHFIAPKQSIRKRFMKKHLLWLLVIFLICSSVIINIKCNVIQQAVSKNFSFIVYKSIDYTSSVYNNTYVQLQITIEKVSGINHNVVYDKTFDAKLLRAYPAPDSAFVQTVTVPNINNKDEHFEVIYTRIYNSKGYKLQIQNAALIDQNSEGRLDIGI